MSKITRRRSMMQLHRWIGLISCLFMLLISGTAIALNHPELLLWKPAATAKIAPQGPAHLELMATDPLQPAHILVSDSQALYESFNGGKNWQEVKLFVPAKGVNAIAFDPQHPKTFWVSVALAGLYQTDDGGEVWEEMNLPFSPVAGEAIEQFNVSQGGFIRVKTKQGIYTYSALTKQWQQSSSLASSSNLQKSKTLSDWIYQLHTGKVFGSSGVYLYDGVALMFIFLALSGIYLSLRPYARRKTGELPVRQVGEIQSSAIALTP